MVDCPGNIDFWRYFKKNSKLSTSAPGRSVYGALSDYIHNTALSARANNVEVPDWLEPVEKRFLLRLFMVKNFQVRVVDTHGNVRVPTESELDTSPENSPVVSPEKKEEEGAKKKKEKKAKRKKRRLI